MLTVGAKPVAATTWIEGLLENGAVIYGGALALGATVGAGAFIIVGSIARPRRYIEIMVGAWSLGAGTLWLAIGVPTAWSFVVAYATSAALMAVGNIYWSTFVQSTVPDRLLTRVISIDWMASLSLTPLGAATAGFIVSSWGAGPMLAVVATVPLISGLSILGALLFNPRFTQGHSPHLPDSDPNRDPNRAGGATLDH